MKPSIKTSMKCKFSNDIHKLFNSLIPEDKKKERYYWKRYHRKLELSKMSDSQKLEMFQKIVDIYENASAKLNSYRIQKRTKKAIQKLRNERGYVPKKKTTKEQWEQMQKGVAV